MLGRRDTCQRWARQDKARHAADDTLAMAHKKIEEALPWSKNRRQITGAEKEGRKKQEDEGQKLLTK